jgi:hypothetical protein
MAGRMGVFALKSGHPRLFRLYNPQSWPEVG